ncbi:hypothetical protein HWV62_12867 [Athelia sp. TMB]|nr:hypothetical protein HWV62_12867 [Athelia sp. TMB]
MHYIQSCKRLDSVSRSLSVWREQYAAFVARNPNTPPLESPLERYSASELESIALQRGSVDAGWRSTTEQSAPMRNIPFKKADSVQTCLIDGGRWLLASALCDVMVYDLDDPKDCGKVLIPRHADAPEKQQTADLQVDVLVDAPTLAFNVAISERRWPDAFVQFERLFENENTPLRVHIWRVALEGHCANAQLQAVHLTSFTTARAVVYKIHDCVEVYDWSASSIQEHRKAVLYAWCVHVHLLSHDRLLLFRNNRILLCGIPALEACCLPSSRPLGSNMTPYNSISLPGTRFVRGGPSQLRFNLSTGCTFMSVTDAGIFVVGLSETTSYAHLFHAIENPKNVTDVVLGARKVYIRSYRFATAFSYEAEHTLVGASTMGYHTTPLQKRSVPEKHFAYLGPKMDEISGRIVMAAYPSSLVVCYYSQYDEHRLFAGHRHIATAVCCD